MPTPKRKILRTTWKTQSSGHLLLREPWEKESPPAILVGDSPLPLSRVPSIEAAQFTGFYEESGTLTFVAFPHQYPRIDFEEEPPVLAGSFNQWANAVKNRKWHLEANREANPAYWFLILPKNEFQDDSEIEFKFITLDGQWLEPPGNAPNLVHPGRGITNFTLVPGSVNSRVFHFTIPETLEMEGDLVIHWKEPGHEEMHKLPRLKEFIEKQSILQLGAIIEGDATIFRIFAPRAETVRVSFWQMESTQEKQHLDLHPNEDGTWENRHPGELHGWHYCYFIDGRNTDETTDFDGAEALVDPYAKAMATPTGPGIILSANTFHPPSNIFQPPERRDLVIVEVHLRDALAKAPINLTKKERRGFSGLTKWLHTGKTYFHELGVNAVELQPIHEFDCDNPEEYHWGYMPVNLFSPASSYAMQPGSASQIQEFRELVQAFHDAGMAVILDVVLNHQGRYTPLHGIDKGYYFELDESQNLTNWSGCGNDMRSDSPMARRLMIDSLVHWVRTFDIDGFRLDLAELLGLETLQIIEETLKREKPGIILIAEPWSFRGHIAKKLRPTGYTSWNDGFREFICQYVKGKNMDKGLEYFLSGSPGQFSRFPAQSLNYIESHDDRCWIDKITENRAHNGMDPTPLDIRRTHLAIATLFMSMGVPMISAGQDFLRSKHGINNTYQQGALNILDYDRLQKFPGTTQYIRDWIRFRRSERGRLLRPSTFPTLENLHFFHHDAGHALAMEIQDGSSRMVFIVNPEKKPAFPDLPGNLLTNMQLLADEERFHVNPTDNTGVVSAQEAVPPLGLRLWHSC